MDNGNFRVGDKVCHDLSKWEGIIVLDLTENPLVFERWRVTFFHKGEFIIKNCFDEELKRIEQKIKRPDDELCEHGKKQNEYCHPCLRIHSE